jgi:hypothetical protein
VETVDDPPMRGGLLATGTLEGGPVGRGATLRDETTGTPVRVLAVEFATRTRLATGRTTLVIDRKDRAAVVSGAVLVASD